MNDVPTFRESILNLQPIDLLSYQEVIPELQLLKNCNQSPKHHSEGDVLIHSNMAAQIILLLMEEEKIDEKDKPLLYLSTILHDIGKPVTSVFNEKKNKITAYGHETAGVPIANEFLKKYFPEFNYKQREKVLRLIEWHMKPRMMMKDGTTVNKLRLLSLAVNTKLLYLLSQADTLGRVAEDMKSGMVLLELFKQECEDIGIWDRPYRVPLATHLDNASYSLARWNILMNDAPENKDTYEAARKLMVQPPKPNFQLMLMVGAPASGKSTVVTQLVKQHPGVKVISMDERRKELTGDTTDQSRNEEVFSWQIKELSKAMKNRESVIIDATNPTRKLRKLLWQIGRQNGALCSAIYFDLSYNTLLERNSKRDRKVPEFVIKRFYDFLQSITPEEADSIFIIDK